MRLCLRVAPLLVSVACATPASTTAPAAPPMPPAPPAPCVETGTPAAAALLDKGELLSAQRTLRDTEGARCEGARDAARELTAKIEAELGRADAPGVELFGQGVRALATEPARARTLLDRALVALERASGSRATLVAEPTASFREARWLADGRHVVTSDYGGFLVDAETGAVVGPFRSDVGAFGVTPDGRWFAYTDYRKLFFLDLAQGRVATKLPFGTIGEAYPVFAATGRFLLATSPNGDALVRYDLDGGKQRWSVPLPWTTPEERPLLRLTLAPDSRFAAVSRTGEDTIVFVETEAGATVATLPRRHDPKRAYPDQQVAADGTFVWPGPHGYEGFRPASRKRETYARAGCGAAKDYAFSHRRDRIVIWEPHAACVWDLAKHAFGGQLVFRPPPPDPSAGRGGTRPPKPGPFVLTQLTWDDEDYAVHANGYAAVHVPVGDARAHAAQDAWDRFRSTGDPSLRPPPSTASRRIDTVKSGVQAGKPVYETWLADATTGRRVQKLGDGVATAAFSPDGARVMVQLGESWEPAATLRFFRAEDGAPLAARFGASTRLMVTHASHAGLVVSYEVDERIAPDGARAQLGKALDYQISSPVGFAGERPVRARTGSVVTLFDPQDGSELLRDPDAPAQDARVAIAPDGSLAAIALPATIRLWDLARGRLAREVPGIAGPKSGSPNGFVGFAPDARHLVVVGDGATEVVDTVRGTSCSIPVEAPVAVGDDRVALGDAWYRASDCARGGPLPQVPITYHRARAAAFSPDGRRLVWTTQDGIAAADVDGGEPIRRKLDRGAAGLVFTPSGEGIVAAGAEGTFDVLSSPDLALRATGLLGADSVALFAPDGRAELLGHDAAAAARIGCRIEDVTYPFALCRGAALTRGLLADVLR